jgi:hypothetical protein
MRIELFLVVLVSTLSCSVRRNEAKEGLSLLPGKKILSTILSLALNVRISFRVICSSMFNFKWFVRANLK